MFGPTGQQFAADQIERLARWAEKKYVGVPLSQGDALGWVNKGPSARKTPGTSAGAKQKTEN
jgi:hypothetical protein